MRIVSLQLGDAMYAIDVASVIEILRPLPITPVPRAAREVAGLINVRGQIIAAIDLRMRLGHPCVAPPMNVLVRVRAGIASLLVDRIGDVFEVDDSLLSRPPPTLPASARGLVTGSISLPDRLVLVLDADRATSLVDDGALS